MKRITKILLCALCAVAAVLCVAAACFMLLKKQSGTTASSAASGASVSIYGKVSDFDYASFDYSEGLDDNGHWTGIRALDYVTLPEDVSALPLSKADIEPTEAEIQTQIDTLLNQYATTQNITDRAAQRGDTVNIDYSGAVDGVAFTGGTATGRNIMKNAGLKKYSMELGGKSPVLIFEDADIERALDAALFTIFSINGERCTAGSRIFIQQSIYPEFVKRFAERANRLRVGDPTDPNTQVGALISQQHWEKVSGYIRLGIEEGATLLAGGADKPSDLPAHLKAGNFLRPTVLADVDNRMRVAQEEIFGPVACLLPFKDEAEGLRLANDVEYGLASYIWTQDVSKVLRLARGIEAGMVFVNTQNVRDLRQPFGGVKASGTGREGGEYSFEVFAEMKNVCISMGDHPIPKWGV